MLQCDIPAAYLPSLVMGLATCSSTHPARFAMLKAWILNPDLGDMDVEEKYKQYAGDERRDRYVTVTLLLWKLSIQQLQDGKQ